MSINLDAGATRPGTVLPGIGEPESMSCELRVAATTSGGSLASSGSAEESSCGDSASNVFGLGSAALDSADAGRG